MQASRKVGIFSNLRFPRTVKQAFGFLFHREWGIDGISLPFYLCSDIEYLHIEIEMKMIFYALSRNSSFVSSRNYLTKLFEYPRNVVQTPVAKFGGIFATLDKGIQPFVGLITLNCTLPCQLFLTFLF